MDDKQNQKIWNDFKAGHHSAFTLIYNQHVDLLYAYGTKICSDDNLVKDCIQEVFIRLFERRDKIRNLDSIKFYLFKSLKNSLIDSLSSHKKMRAVSENIEFEIEYSAEKYWIDNEVGNSQKKKIKNALNQLTSKQKEIINLRYNHGLSFAQIAEIVGVNAASAKKQTYRTLGKLRELLDLDGTSE
ncbi:RNA polymerase sigma factor [Maribellus maritimus]|uniref:RNA polymerase sigma factor n=1 Tax=Maribellus maritimus TaxID=2870838 RepID=UPI001EE9FE9D|nr:sigma-70 family RNA polymerase sigma factor [Maribellus maritimus]MCG6189375.1 sigma-70 family RNA polymerase sigma factor [Maribellus maritimus]